MGRINLFEEFYDDKIPYPLNLKLIYRIIMNQK